MQTLLERFDSIKVSDSALLPEEDIKECELVQTAFNIMLAELQSHKAFLSKKVEEENTPYYKIEHYHDKRFHVSKRYEVKGNDDFSAYQFTYKYSWLAIDPLIDNLKITFVHRILHYFKTKYNLEIEDIGSKETDNYLTYQKILRHIDEKCGGLDMKQQAIRQAINRFRTDLNLTGNRVSWNKKDVYIKGKVLEIMNYYPTSGTNYRYEKELDHFREALSIFEKEEPKDDFEQLYFPNHYDPNRKYEFSDECEKLKSIKIQKAKMMITFVDETAARQFCSRFEIPISTPKPETT